ncbi:MAG: hypothetical protein [Inoviridae sp.]|nr:MAG: hypothetical protein [Inoviridae sp.]
MASTEIHFIHEHTELDINISSLAEQKDRDMIMALQLKPVPDLRTESLEITVIPDHSHLIDKNHRFRRKCMGADKLNVKKMGTGNINSRIHLLSPAHILEGLLYQKSGLTRTLFAKNQDKLIRITVLPDHKGTEKQKKEKNNKKNHLRTPFTSLSRRRTEQATR